MGEACRLALLLQTAYGQTGSHPGTGNAGAAGAAVGLQNVAVNVNGALAQGFQIEDGAQAAADQTLDFLGAAILLATGGFTVRAGVCGARQHAVFCRYPALLLAFQKGGTLSSTLALHKTWVSPRRISTEPSA